MGVAVPSRSCSTSLALLGALLVTLGCGSAVPATPSQAPTHRIQPTQPVAATATPVPPTTAPTEETLPPTEIEAFGPIGETQRASVVEIIDGATIRVRFGGSEYAVRYVGIEVPDRGAPLARRATRTNAELVEGQRLWLELDVSQTDEFDQLLRHVWLHQHGRWLLVNAELVRLGLARAVSYPPDTRYDVLYAAAQAEAQEAGLGIWSAE